MASLVSTIPVPRSEFDAVLDSASEKLDVKVQRPLSAEWMPTSLGTDAFFGTNQSNLALAEYVPSLVEDLFTFLVHVVAERARCGYDERQYLRRRLVHRLAGADSTHFSLLEYIGRHSQQPQPDQRTVDSPRGTEKSA